MDDKYIEIDGKPIPENDLMKWGGWMQTANRTVAKTKIGKSIISTVFLGLDHSFGGPRPLLYETMIFWGPMDQEVDRYPTRECAEEGHLLMVRRAKELAND